MCKISVKRLKELLEPIDDDLIVRVSVNYNNCDHIQDLKHIDFFEDIPWITLRGK